jgi:hypothetical protein
MEPTEVLTQFRTRVVRDSITRPADTTAYSAGDVISEATTNDHYTFGAAGTSALNDTKLARAEVGTGTINKATLYSSANQATKLDAELWLFTSDITEVADNSAFAPSDAEVLTLVDIISFPTTGWKIGNATAGAGGNAVCVVVNIDRPYKTGTSGILYGQLVARNGYTPVSGEVFTVDLTVTQD